MQTTEVPYEVSLRKTHSTVTLRPALTDAEWSDIQKAGDDILSQISESKPKALLIDLSALNYMGSSMVAMIVRCWKSLKENKEKFVVVSDSDVVREVLQLSGLAKMWTIAPSTEAGLKTLGIKPESGGSSGAETWGARIGIVATLTAIAGIIVWFAQPAQRELATGLIYGGAGLAFVLGLTVMMISQSKRRFVGLGMVVMAAGLGLFRIMQQ